MSENSKITANSINPFYSLYEFVSKPVSISRDFFYHSLDDFAEDVVTIAGMAVTCYAMPYAAFSVQAALLLPAYYITKRVADYAGEAVEDMLKEEPNKQDSSDENNFLIKMVDDIAEDLSKGMCVSFNVAQSVFVVEAGQRFIPRKMYGGALNKFNFPKLVKVADVVSGGLGAMATYSQCDELANAHGHWVADQINEFFSPQSDLAGDMASKEENEEL